MFKVISCMRCEGINAPPIPGAVQTSCARCERAVWIAPSSLDFLSRYPDTVVYCDQDAQSYLESL